MIHSQEEVIQAGLFKELKIKHAYINRECQSLFRRREGGFYGSLPLILEVRAMQYLSLYRLLCTSARRRYLETLKLNIYAAVQ